MPTSIVRFLAGAIAITVGTVWLAGVQEGISQPAPSASELVGEPPAMANGPLVRYTLSSPINGLTTLTADAMPGDEAATTSSDAGISSFGLGLSIRTWRTAPASNRSFSSTI